MNSATVYQLLIAHPIDESIVTSVSGKLPTTIYEGDFSYVECISTSIREELLISFEIKLLRRECTVLEANRFRPMLLIFEIPFTRFPALPETYTWTPKSKADGIIFQPDLPEIGLYLRRYSV